MNKIEYTDNFKAIITFFLFECPLENVSHRGKTFKEIGWHGSSRFQMLERLLKDCTTITDHDWISCDKSEVEEKIKCVSGLCYIVCNKDKGSQKSVIYAIRNAFAHGSFDVSKIDGDIYYYFVNNYKGRLRAKIFIEENALLEWIKIIKTNPEFLTKKARKKAERERKKNEQTNK